MKDGHTVRDKILDLEAKMKTLPQLAIKETHHFSKGLYAREIFIPKGTLLVGKIHKFDNLNIVSQGDISVLTEDGAKRIKAPFTTVSKPGTKRVGYAHEDTIWTCIHATEETDLEKIENEIIAKTFDELTMISAQEILELKGAE